MSSASSRQPANHLHLQQPGKSQDGLAEPTVPNVSEVANHSAANDDSTSGRQQPISPPSEPMQYRAIGLVRGRYVPSGDQFNRGHLQTADGTILDAVLLGQVMSLVKKHLDLETSHLWVVYPRTREKQAGLHIQIVGVWEPEALQQSEDGTTAAASEELAAPQADDYFSVRGEVMFQSPDQEYIVVRIQQSPRKTSEEPKSFKLRLEGALPTRAVGYFWDLEVQRQGNQLVIQRGQSIAMVPPKKPAQKSKKPLRAGSRYGATRPGQMERPVRPGKPGDRPPISKPIKRNDSRPMGG